MLVNSNDILKRALKEGYAIPAYNINNLEWTRYILEACNSDRCPVILAVTPSSIKYFGGYNIVVNVVKSLIDELDIKVPVVLHLDHGSSFESCKAAIDAGFTSVMIDASKESLETNIEITNKVIEYANKNNVSVEAEVGAMNLEEGGIDESYCSSIDDCVTFINSTNVDSLAPSIGNRHGIYKGPINLNFELLGNLCKELRVPLVLHGASGLDENKLRTAIFCGVCKININTDLQVAWTNSVRQYLNDNKDVYDPRWIISSGQNAIKKVVHEHNMIFNNKNRAI